VSFGPKTRFVENLLTRLERIKWFLPPSGRADYRKEVEAVVRNHVSRLDALGFLDDSALDAFGDVRVIYTRGNWAMASRRYLECRQFVNLLHDEALRHAERLVGRSPKAGEWRAEAKQSANDIVEAALGGLAKGETKLTAAQKTGLKQAAKSAMRDSRSIASAIVSRYESPWEPLLDIYEMGLFPVGLSPKGVFHVFVPGPAAVRAASNRVLSVTEVDLGIITALPVELTAVLDTLKGRQAWNSEVRPPHEFHRGTFKRRGSRSLDVVAAKQCEMGMVSAAILATRMIDLWHPRFIFVVGICGVRRDPMITPGDVIVGTKVFNYQEGKATPDGFEPDYTTYESSALLCMSVDRFLSHEQHPWQETNAALRPSGAKAPQVHLGVFGSGDVVIASKEFVVAIKARQRKLLAVEMEGAAVFKAARESPKPPDCLILKAVSDYADPSKGDRFRKYAAAMAAKFAYHFACDSIEN
jgi:nucleoside phosphorylase